MRLQGIWRDYHVANHEDPKFYWDQDIKEPVIEVELRDASTVRGTLLSAELRPETIWFSRHNFADDVGLWSRIIFDVGEIDDVRVRFEYDGYLWGHGRYVFDSNDSWEKFGYKNRGYIEGHPMQDLLVLKR